MTTDTPKGLIALSDLASGRLRPPPALLEGFLLDRTITQVSSAPYTGKSLLLAAIMLSLDTGLPLLGRFQVPKRKSVLFLGSDAPTWDYAQVAVKLIRGLGLTADQCSKLQSHVKYNSGWKLTSPDVQKHLKSLHSDIGFGVLMLDTFRRFHPLNQNDDREMAAFMELLKGLRDDLNIAIIFTNHERKPSDSTRGSDPNYSARGSTEISAAVDFNLVLQKRPKQGIRLHLPKGRGAAPDDLDALDFQITYGGTEQNPSLTLEPVEQSPGSHQLVLRIAGTLDVPFSRSALVEGIAKEGHERPSRIADTGIAWLQRNHRIISTGRGQWKLTSP